MTTTTTARPFDIATHNGTITIQSLETGAHRTVQIKTEKWGDDEKRIAKLLRGTDNESDYYGFAFVDTNGARLWNKHKSSETLDWICRAITNPERFEHKVKFLFEGRCRICNRKLTTPQSLASGIGPTCEGRE